MNIQIELPIPQDKIKDKIAELMDEINSRKNEIKVFWDLVSSVRNFCKHDWDGPYYSCGHNVGDICKVCGLTRG